MLLITKDTYESTICEIGIGALAKEFNKNFSVIHSTDILLIHKLKDVFTYYSSDVMYVWVLGFSFNYTLYTFFDEILQINPKNKIVFVNNYNIETKPNFLNKEDKKYSILLKTLKKYKNFKLIEPPILDISISNIDNKGHIIKDSFIVPINNYIIKYLPNNNHLELLYKYYWIFNAIDEIKHNPKEWKKSCLLYFTYEIYGNVHFKDHFKEIIKNKLLQQTKNYMDYIDEGEEITPQTSISNIIRIKKENGTYQTSDKTVLCINKSNILNDILFNLESNLLKNCLVVHLVNTEYIIMYDSSGDIQEKINKLKIPELFRLSIKEIIYGTRSNYRYNFKKNLCIIEFKPIIQDNVSLDLLQYIVSN